MFDDIMEAEVTPTLFIKAQLEADIDSYLKGIPLITSAAAFIRALSVDP